MLPGRRTSSGGPFFCVLHEKSFILQGSGDNGVKFAIMGCGEVGLLYAESLLPVACQMFLCDPRPSQRTLRFVQDHDAKLVLAPDAWLNEVDVVLSCVVGSVSLQVALETFPLLHAGAIYADLTTSDPDSIRDAARKASAADIRYVDIAIMGAVALTGLKTPLLLAGNATAEMESFFKQIGAPASSLRAGEAGDASRLKLLRSSFTKGLEALAIETFMAAEYFGVTDELYRILADIDKHPLRSSLESFIGTHVLHAQRRLKEIEAAQRLLSEANVNGEVLRGARELFTRTWERAQQQSSGEIPLSSKEVLAWLAAK